MTCIVGLEHAGAVWLGADSAGVEPGRGSLVVRRDAKVFRRGTFGFGFTSSFRMGQLLRYSLVIPARVVGEDLEHYMATRFINAVRECFRAGGYLTKDNEREEGGSFLVATAGRLFEVGSDFQVGWNGAGYAAVGAGDLQALGALHATAGISGLREHPRARVLGALRAAEALSAFVRRPFKLHCFRGKDA